jgi:hypothetical protein
MWSRDDFLLRLQQIIRRKTNSRGAQMERYARYILVIITDEFALGHADVAQFLRGAIFRSKLITDAFLGLSYDPSFEGGSCPVFKLELVRE